MPVTDTTVLRYKTPHIDVHLCVFKNLTLITESTHVQMMPGELFPLVSCRFGLGVAKVPVEVIDLTEREFGSEWQTELCVGCFCGRATEHLAARPLWLPQ